MATLVLDVTHADLRESPTSRLTPPSQDDLATVASAYRTVLAAVNTAWSEESSQGKQSRLEEISELKLQLSNMNEDFNNKENQLLDELRLKTESAEELSNTVYEIGELLITSERDVLYYQNELSKLQFF